MKVRPRLYKVIISAGVGPSLCSGFNTIWGPEVVESTSSHILRRGDAHAVQCSLEIFYVQAVHPSAPYNYLAKSWSHYFVDR